MKLLLIILSILPFLHAEYTKFQWADCGSRELQIYDADIKPMPILQPGIAYLNLKMNLKRALSGKLNTKINIIRTVSGIALPIRCYIAGGVYVGSCTYDGKLDFNIIIFAGFVLFNFVFWLFKTYVL